METYVQTVEISMLRHVPELIAWGIGLVLAIIMLRRGGVKAEKLLLAGCSLMFVAPLSSLLMNNWLSQLALEQDMSYIDMMRSPAWIVLSIVIGVLSLAGLVCLIWAFLSRFKARKPAGAA